MSYLSHVKFSAELSFEGNVLWSVLKIGSTVPSPSIFLNDCMFHNILSNEIVFVVNFWYIFRSIKSDCPCLWSYYVKWSCSNKSPSDVANLIHRFTARHSSSHLTANFLHLYFAMDQNQNGNQVATDLLHNIRKEFIYSTLECI